MLDRVLLLKTPSVKTPPKKEAPDQKKTMLENSISGPKKLRFIKDVQKFVNYDKSILGPFSAGSETVLDEKIAGILLKKGYAEEI
ncbi:hypothetical protein GOV10_05610 [Candidatus Woesearchaeota archaeon]|nr:hypothetical protein [Candidatus Woesearchaeota archaeon]